MHSICICKFVILSLAVEVLCLFRNFHERKKKKQALETLIWLKKKIIRIKWQIRLLFAKNDLLQTFFPDMIIVKYDAKKHHVTIKYDAKLALSILYTCSLLLFFLL